MINHPNRYRGPFTAEVFEGGLRQGSASEFATIPAAHEWAKSFGDKTDSYTIINNKGKIIGHYRRNSTSDGKDWIKVRIE